MAATLVASVPVAVIFAPAAALPRQRLDGRRRQMSNAIRHTVA